MVATTVSPNPSDRELIDAVCGGKVTPEKAIPLLRGDDDAKMYLLQMLAGNKLPLATGLAIEARLSQIAEARAAKRAAGTSAGRLSLRVSAKGALSIYGLQRQFPVTLYVEQWEKVLGIADEMRQFIRDNAGKLSRKAPATK